MEAIVDLHRRGLLRPSIVELNGFTDYSRAFELIADRRQSGKVVMRLSEERARERSGGGRPDEDRGLA